ncbi:MAG: glycosyltransferase family 4 protein [Hungateiclostridium thermocellum]|nr:glycosyltransferase family 4 protein [Acetivibrio thermocellus]THJ78027.1 glycosyltransferase [Acetivibrio thermocellus]
MIGHKMVPSRCGGIEFVLTTICPMLVEKGHDVTCYNRAGGKLENEYVGTVKNNMYKGVKLKKVFTLNKKGLAAMTSSFFAAICAAFKDYDIVHFHAEGPCAALWIPKLFGKKCVCTIHGIDWQREKWKGSFGSKYIKFGEKIAAKFADEVIVLSKTVQDYFQREYGRETVFIPNGVIKPELMDAKIIKSQYGLSGNDYILFLGRLVPEKGLRYLIEAFKQVKTDKKLVIAGDASDTDSFVHEIKDMAKDDKRIIFTGFVQGRILQELYSNAYVYVLPSDLEGMPLSLLEAMSYGNCCLVSNIPECTDVVEDKAVIFKRGDVIDLQKKLQELCDHIDLVNKYKEDVSDFICNKYNWNDVVEQTEALYIKIYV